MFQLTSKSRQKESIVF